MNRSARKLLEEALHLEESERSMLAGAEIGVEEAWERVIERRIRELEAGTAETIPWSEVRARLFRGYMASCST
jgi:hypothetical protein